MVDDYDLIILDCPPGISLVGENVIRAAGTLLVPLIPTTLSVRTLEQLGEFVGELDRPPALFPFFTMVDGRKRLHEIIGGLPRLRLASRTVVPPPPRSSRSLVPPPPPRVRPPQPGHPQLRGPLGRGPRPFGGRGEGARRFNRLAAARARSSPSTQA